LGLVGGTAQADAISDFYKKTQVKVIVGSSSDGGYDTYARTLARHFNRHIPGKPRMIMQNMIGAGGIIASNYVYGIGPQDGSIIGAV
jgi:tripartite-type tricarboxylate transporter receptor subunit TctC